MRYKGGGIPLINVNKDSFDKEILQTEGITLVDWWGPKCEKCLEIMPYLEEISESSSNKMRFCKINVAENRRLAIEHKVLGLPTISFYKAGKKVDEISGDIDRAEIEEKIQKYLI